MYELTLDHLVRRAITGMVAATNSDVAWYLGLPATHVRAAIERLVSERIVRAVDILGSRRRHYATEEGVESLLFRTSKPALPTRGLCRVISPFDCLVANRDRLERLIGLHFRAELFTPAENRIGATTYPLVVIKGDLPSKILWLKSYRGEAVLRILGSERLRGRSVLSQGDWVAIERIAKYIGLRLE